MIDTAERAIEGAVNAIKDGKSFEKWSRSDKNIPRLKATSYEIWAIAMWIVNTPCIPAKHGRWLVDPDDREWYKCSECEREVYWPRDIKPAEYKRPVFSYCVNCGAKMR